MDKREELRQATGLLTFLGTGLWGNRLQIRADHGAGLAFEGRAFEVGGELFTIRMSTQARNEGFGEDAAADRNAQGVRMAGNGDFSDAESEVRARVSSHDGISTSRL